MSVSILVARGLLAEVTRRGCDAEALLRRAGLERGRIENLREVLHLGETERLVDAAVSLTGDPGIGLEAGVHAPPHALQLFGHLVLAQATLRDAFSTLIRYASLLSDGVRWRLAEVGESAIFSCSLALDDGDLSRVLIDYTFALMANIGRLFHAGGRAHEVHFRHAPPPYLTRYAGAFRGEVLFAQGHNAFVLPRALVDRPQLHADPLAQAMLRDTADALERERSNPPSLGECVRVMLRHERDLASVSLASAARALRLTAYEFKSKLRQEGTSFSILLDAARCHAACRELSRPGGSIQKAADRSGFQEMSAFFRAFKRWTGRTPDQFRRLDGETQAQLATTPLAKAATRRNALQ